LTINTSVSANGHSKPNTVNTEYSSLARLGAADKAELRPEDEQSAGSDAELVTFFKTAIGGTLGLTGQKLETTLNDWMKRLRLVSITASTLAHLQELKKVIKSWKRVQSADEVVNSAVETALKPSR
jgi:hypothetical protein